VLGDVIYEIYYQEGKKNRLALLKRRLILPSIVIGGILVAFIFLANSFLFLNLPTFYGIISTIGISLILFSVLILLEEYEIFKTKKNYKFIFYFSYYSLTIYIAHNLLYFLFFKRLNALESLFYIVIVVVLIGLFLKLIYPKLGAYLSIKKMLSYFSYKLVMKIEETKILDESE
jgi:multidrug transporter EmrE-like cation transporter